MSLSEPGKPYRINVDIVQGSITVTGYEGKDIIIDAKADDRRGESMQNSFRRIPGGGDLDVFARQKNNVVTIGTGHAGPHGGR